MSFRARRRNSFKRVAMTGTIAAAAGYVAGLLTAPKSGQQTRGDIKQAADKSLAQAEKELKQVNRELSKVIDEAKAASDKLEDKARRELEVLVQKAKDTKEKSREMLSALHEGEAQDKDLARAVKNAQTALKHLRTYLKK